MKVTLNTILYNRKSTPMQGKSPTTKADFSNYEDDGNWGYNVDHYDKEAKEVMRSNILSQCYNIESWKEKCSEKEISELLENSSNKNGIKRANLEQLGFKFVWGDLLCCGTINDANKSLEKLKNSGIKTFIALCDMDENFQKRCEKLGIEYIRFDYNDSKLNTGKNIKMLLEIVKNPSFVGYDTDVYEDSLSLLSLRGTIRENKG